MNDSTFHSTFRSKVTVVKQSFVISFVAAALIGPAAFAWGPEGHQTVGELARTLLSQKARNEVKMILHDDDLAALATWADEVRAASRGKGPLVNDASVAQFNTAHPHNDKWHFVNLPLDIPSYPQTGEFASGEDVVHAINRCVAVLEKQSTEFSKRDALALLVHFVGDIHQPLHVGTGYYKFDDAGIIELITDPIKAAGRPDDVGGNDLFYGPSRFDELHGFWDGELVKNVADTTSYHKLTIFLTNKVDNAAWKSTGNHHHWADAWAEDSLKVASSAYRDLRFKEATFNAHHGLRQITIDLPDRYTEIHTKEVETQLAKAGFHLAELLNAIKW